MFRYAALAVPALLLASAPAAAALELDSLLPPGVPGFGPDITVISRLQRGLQRQPISIGGITVSPELDATTGYDSAPTGAPGGSSTILIAPSLLASDSLAGFGAYAGIQTSLFPENPSENATDYTIAAGEAAILAQNTITFAAALARTQLTGFQLEPVAGTPSVITGTAVHASDDFATGMLIITPDISEIRAVSTGALGQTSTETGAGLKLQIIPDGVLRLIIYGHATWLAYRDTTQNAADDTAFIGISDKAEGLWNFRLAAGLTSRQPASGKSTLIPIAEAAADWLPDDLTSLEFTAAHEIDDPTRIDTSSYTISEAKLSIAHEYLRNVILTASIAVTRAAFFAVPLAETITQSQAAIAWRLNPNLKLSAAYNFNDREANHLRAAQEHIATISLAWSL